jgi:hypothetical protein
MTFDSDSDDELPEQPNPGSSEYRTGPIGAAFGVTAGPRTPESFGTTTSRPGVFPAGPHGDDQTAGAEYATDPRPARRKHRKHHNRQFLDQPSVAFAQSREAFGLAMTEVIRTAVPDLGPGPQLDDAIDYLFHSFPAELIPGGTGFGQTTGGYQQWPGYRYY